MATQTNDIKTRLDGVTAFVVTNLQALPGGQIWRSIRVSDPSPHSDQVTISFSIVCNPAVAADDKLNFYWADSDEGAPVISAANVAATEGRITVANEISDVQDICDLVFSVRIDRVNQILKGSFILFSPGPSWQLLVELESAAGTLAVAASVVRYRLGTPQVQP